MFNLLSQCYDNFFQLNSIIVSSKDLNILIDFTSKQNFHTLKFYNINFNNINSVDNIVYTDVFSKLIVHA